jgi:hypothetical protein
MSNETRFFRNNFVITSVLFSCCVLVSGCLTADKQTVEMRLITSEKGRVTYLYYGIKSDSKERGEIKKDFDDLIASISEKSRADVYENDKLKIEQWNIDIDVEGNVYGAAEATFNIAEFFDYNDYKMSNEEILITLPIVKNQKLTSNGKIVKTKNNYILVWPKGSKDLQWTIVDKGSLKLPNNLNKFFTQ